MWTRKSHFLIFRLRVKGFCIPLAILPFRSLEEIVEGLTDIVSLFRPFPKKVLSAVTMLQVFFEALRAYGHLDLVRVSVRSEDGPVRVNILLR